MSMRTVQLFFISVLSCLFILPSAAAAADDLIVIPVSGFARGAEGDVVSIANVGVPSETVGATCQIIGHTVNQVSVHPGNDLLIITNGQTFVIPDFEDAGFIEHEAGEVTSVGETIELQIRFGPDGVSSGGFRVRVECDPENFPTTTVAEATTTTETPDTTVAESTTTTEEPPAGPTTEAPATTTTTEEPLATTVPSTDSTDTSVAGQPPATEEEPPAGPTTEAPETTTTTAAPTTSEEPPAGPSAEDDATLPVTGSSTDLIVGLGVLLVAAGALLRRFSLTSA